MSLIKILNADSQINKNVFQLLENFTLTLNSENWIKNYIFWELELFKVLGFDLELEKLVEKKIIGNRYQYFTKSVNDKKIVPNFLVDKNENNENFVDLLNGLKLVGDYLEKTILKPNNLSQPNGRLQFISTLR